MSQCAEQIAGTSIMDASGTVRSLGMWASHGHIIKWMSDLGIRAGCDGQGFITTRGRFVDRIEGLELAIASGQIVHKHNPKYELLSEDMRHYDNVGG